MRYKVWRSAKDKELHLLCAVGSEVFSALPTAIRHLGPWTGGAEGEINRLRLPYRSMLAEQDFAVIYAPVAKLQLESVTSVHALHPANTDCPECEGKGRVPMHHGLRDKESPRCVDGVSRPNGRASRSSSGGLAFVLETTRRPLPRIASRD